MIFISYPRKRAAIAHLIKIILDLRGYKTFMDLTELVGGDWNEQLQNAIKKSDDIVVVIAKECTHSKAMESEIKFALDLGKKIVPVILDEIENTTPEWISRVMRYQAVNFEEMQPATSTDAIAKLLTTQKTAAPNQQSDKIELIKNMALGATIALIASTAFLTNPSPKDHTDKITRGPFASFQIDRDLFYDDFFFYSEVYTLSNSNERVRLSTGIFGKVIESKEFNLSLENARNK
jgi:TIR domain